MNKWHCVKNILPEINTKVLACFDYFTPAYPECDSEWHATRQFIAYINDKKEWMIYGPYLSHHAEPHFIAMHWMPEVAYPEEIIDRNVREVIYRNSRRGSDNVLP